MNSGVCLVVCLLLTQGVAAVTFPHGFHWDWRSAQELSAAQSLGKLKVSNSGRAAIAKAIEAQTRPDMSALEIKSEADLLKAALDTRIKMIDLNGDGVPEVIAQGMGVADCGAVGNCSFWVFQKTRAGYKLLLDGGGQTFTIQKRSTGGFKEIVVAHHDSAGESGLTVYRYIAGAYQSVACYDANFWSWDGGTYHELKEPQVTPTPCEP
ncbi:MAG: hypothetical protein WA020_05455 [Candidatus Acidiferrales bacterium]